jgi:hypothetical protein
LCSRAPWTINSSAGGIGGKSSGGNRRSSEGRISGELGVDGGPPIGAGDGAEAGIERVLEDDVADRPVERFLVADHPGAEASAEEVAPPSAPAVEVLRVAAVQPLHAVREVLALRLHHQVVVVAEQAVGGDAPVVAARDDEEHREEDEAVERVAVDHEPVDAARPHVEVAVGEQRAEDSHAYDGTRAAAACLCQKCANCVTPAPARKTLRV